MAKFDTKTSTRRKGGLFDNISCHARYVSQKALRHGSMLLWRQIPKNVFS